MKSLPSPVLRAHYGLSRATVLLARGAAVAVGCFALTVNAVPITNPTTGLDVNGNQIMQVDTGSIVKQGSTYYWFGRDGTQLNHVKCYTSSDLVTWNSGTVVVNGTSGQVAASPGLLECSNFQMGDDDDVPRR